MALDVTQMIGQTVKKQVTITAGSTSNVTIPIPKQTKVYLKGYGYSWYTSNTYKLSTGNLTFPKRTDQEGSASIPRVFERAYECRSGGNCTLTITNGDSADHTYDVVFYFMTEHLLEGTDYECTGGELIIATGSGGTSGQNVVIYNSSVTTAANVTAKGLQVDPQVPTTLLAGNLTLSTNSATALGASTTCKKITVQADVGNADPVFVGNAAGQYQTLDGGQSVDIEIDDLAKIYVKRTAGSSAVVNYLGS